MITTRRPEATMRSIRIEPICGALGAEIHGIDLGRSPPDTAIDAIKRALGDHLVVFFRDQPLAPDDFLAFARRFGEPVAYPFLRGLDDHPLIVPVVKLEHEAINFGGVWHSDTAYLERPPKATLLLAREVPPVGGDTLFANADRALAALSPAMRAMLGTLAAVNVADKAEVSRTRAARIRERGRVPESGCAGGAAVAVHPVVRVDPETGRRSLYVNRAHTLRFQGMTEAESAPILDFLHRHLTRPEFTCRFRWRPGSLAFWDNRRSQHYPLNDYHGQRRVMHRITLAGERPA